MHCTRCGSDIPEGNKFCNMCGQEVSIAKPIVPEQNSQTTEPVNTTQQVSIPQQSVDSSTTQNESNDYQVKTEKKGLSPLGIVLIIIGSVVVLFILLLVAIYFFVVKSSSNMVCKSPKGEITIYYNDSTILGYTTNNYEYDLENERETAKNIGIFKYLEEFDKWFMENENGTCEYSNKVDNTRKVFDNLKTVGNDYYGYIDIPDDWGNFQDVEGNDALQFSYGNLYIATLNVVENVDVGAKEFAESYMYNRQQSQEVTDVNGSMVTIGNNGQYTAYQVYMYYPALKIYLVTFWFEAEDGKIHYIAIEGPKEIEDMKLADFLVIPESYRLKQ